MNEQITDELDKLTEQTVVIEFYRRSDFFARFLFVCFNWQYYDNDNVYILAGDDGEIEMKKDQFRFIKVSENRIAINIT